MYVTYRGTVYFFGSEAEMLARVATIVLLDAAAAA